MRIRPAICGLFLALLFGIASTARVSAQPLDPAVIGERIQRLTAAVESLELALASQKRQIDALGNELHKVREDVTRQNENQRLANPRPWADELKRLADAISEVDRKRVADGEQVVRVLSDLKKAVASSTEVPKPSRAAPQGKGGAGKGSSEPSTEKPEKEKEKAPEKVLEYVIERGQRLSDVIGSFNEEAKRQGYQTLSVSQVMKFNNIKDDKKIREGTKIQLPVTPAR